jgi:hypothetical protein
MTEDQRIEEGKRMFSIFAARMFEQRVLQAYREKVAQERQLQLLRELEDESKAEREKEEKKAKESAKKKEKKKFAVCFHSSRSGLISSILGLKSRPKTRKRRRRKPTVLPRRRENVSEPKRSRRS